MWAFLKFDSMDCHWALNIISCNANYLKKINKQAVKKQKSKKRKTQQSKAKEERKKENILCKTFTTTVPWNFNLICFIWFWRFFCHFFTEQVIPSKIWSYNHVTPDHRLNVTSTSVSDITVRNTTELVACLCPLNCILHEDREVVRMLIFFSLYKNGPR